MSVERTEAGHVANTWSEDEEIDLRKYIDILVRWWREILLITLVIIAVAALAVVALKAVLAPRYEAIASVAIVRTFSDVSFDPRFKTQTDDATAAQASSAASRRSALIGLASSGAIAQKVIDQLGDKLSGKEKIPANLALLVTAELASGGRSGGDSDLINITAKADSPEKATAIANAWAQVYVQTVNGIYGQVPDDLLTSIEAELATVQKNYAKAQTDLEAFVANNHIDDVTRQITETQSVIDNLQRGKKDALTRFVDGVVNARGQVIQEFLKGQTDSQVVAYKKEQEGRQALITAYLNAINNAQVDVFKQQSDRDLQLLNNYYATWQQATRALADATSLKAQVEKGGDGAVRSSSLALQLLKLQVFTQVFTKETQPNPDPSNNKPTDVSDIRLQFQVTDNAPVLTQAEMLADLNSLIGVLDKRRQDLETQIATLSNQLLSGSNYNALGKTIPINSKLAQSVQQQYAKLADPSWSSMLTATVGTPISSTLGQPLAANQSIEQLGQQWAADLLQLKGLANIPASNADGGSVAQTITQLEKDKLFLKSQLEAERARQLRLTQQRDLNWDTFKTLSNKVAELGLARAANSSEVRFASPAIPPVEPVARVSLLLVVAGAAALGLLLAVIIAFMAEYVGKAPFLRRSSPPESA
jgi:uncharacterized protein involved in exopolysaccharide biosynthesis